MSNKVIIIAEAGVNHNGDISTAKKLIDAASNAQADYIKFQTFKAENIVSVDAKKATYQKINSIERDDSQYSMLKKLELPYEWHTELINYSIKKNIKFLSTGFDIESVDFLDKINIDIFKIPSGEITNKPYIEHIATKKKDIILSTGMSDMTEIQDAINLLLKNGITKNKITVLHCNTEYPTPMKDVNLLAMKTIENELNVKVGYSDHTLGIEIPIAAVALGAKVIEKHFTLDRNLEGPDHRASLEPNELNQMIKSIRNIEKAMSGDGVKKASESEIKNLHNVRKSLHFRNNLNAGHIISFNDLIALRPGSGISPMNIDNYIGKILIKDVVKNEMLSNEFIQ